ncbi:hypothetical protein GCM10022393_00550 [Aquimarina addita]|uniref:DUF4373 domain-containing protein n=1 Tax=Aquimarina addita TaxID=870485 RepID=A0ABP7X7R9_9FLAO
MKNNTLKTNLKQNEFMGYIVKSLGMQMEDFMTVVFTNNTHTRCYEKIIFRWMIKLFDKGKSKNQALKIIYKARIFVILRKSSQANFTPEPVYNLQDLLPMLSMNTTYQKLTDEEKLLVQKKIEAWTDTNSPQDIIAQALSSVNPPIEVEKETNKIKVNRTTMASIKKVIRSINPKNYWEKNKEENSSF